MLYRAFTSGRWSLSTRTGMKCSLTKLITPSSEYDVSSITWHQWHHTAESESSTGLPVSFASRKASSPHPRHLISCARLARGEKRNVAGAVTVPGYYASIGGAVSERCDDLR